MTALERLARAADEQRWKEVPSRDAWPCIEVAREDALPLLTTLRERCGFEVSTYVTAIDRVPAAPRFEVVWGLLSIEHGDRLRVRARVPEDDPRVDSVIGLWPGAAYSERECWDMFGIAFEGHAGLKRLLMPEGYGHHPLRKEFPHQGIEPDRLYREWERSRREGAPR